MQVGVEKESLKLRIFGLFWVSKMAGFPKAGSALAGMVYFGAFFLAGGW